MKLCVACRHFKFESDVGYSMTWPDVEGSVEIGCKRGHWAKYGLGTDQTDFYRGVRMAETCSDFDPLTPEEIAAM